MTQQDEQRVVDALRAYTGGLTVTDQDITVAESRLRERLEPPPPRRRLILLAAAVAAVLVVGFFASRAIDWNEKSAPPVDKPSPATSLKQALQRDAYNRSSEEFTAGPRPTAQTLAGFWLLREPYSGAMFVDGDGDWVMGAPTNRGVFGASTLAGDTWTRRNDERSQCGTDNVGRALFQSWRAALAADGSLRLDLTGGEGVCTPADSREVWDHVAPGSPVSDYLLAVARDAHWQGAPRSFQWRGLYVAPATGHVLEALDDETYRYYDSVTAASLAATDQGEITADGAKISGSCAGGRFEATATVTQLPGVTAYFGSYDAVRITALSDTCESGLIAGQDVWVNINR